MEIRDWAIAAEDIQRQLERLDHVEENLAAVDCSVLVVRNGIEHKFPTIEEASNWIAERMRDGQALSR